MPDVVSSFQSNNVGIFCPSGGWIDLAPYLKRDKINVNIFPAASRYYTQYKGTRCALPLLADTFGFYYNKALFKKAGLKGPPKTFSELSAYAKKLTVKKADGSLDVVGYNPNALFYHGGAGISTYGTLVGATYFDKNGKSNLSRDAGWARLLKWQKALVDYYGYDKLVRWQTGAGDEFSASHAFEPGKLAMMLDGEWRVAFLKNEHPELKYGTAPMPVDRANKSGYGSGYVNGTIIGIPKGAKHAEEAWKLVKYLTTNDHALAKFSNGIRNVPSTRSSSRSPELIPDKNFNTFLKIFTHPQVVHDPDHADRSRPPPDVLELRREVVCGRREGPPGRPPRRRQDDRLEDQAEGLRRHLALGRVAAARASAPAAATLGPSGGQEDAPRGDAASPSWPF